ncbi:MAG TPA: hypothetical protein VGO60_16025, partial [Iamia sp.]|nr:hypothetical protein [Iamia sp.]
MTRFLSSSERVFGSWQVLTTDGEGPPLPGELSYDPDAGLLLSLIGHLDGVERSPLVGGSPVEHEVIIGRTDREQITLFSCSQTSSRINVPGDGASSYRAMFALFGGEVDAPTPLSATEITFRIPLFDAWLPIGGLRTTWETRKSDRRMTRYTQVYEPPEDVEIQIPSAKLTISPAASFGVGRPAERRAEITEWLSFNLEVETELPMTTILNQYVSPLTDLATLLTTYSAEVTHLAVLAPVENIDGTTATERQPLDVLYHRAGSDFEMTEVKDDRFLIDPRAAGMLPPAELVARWFMSRGSLRRAMD